MDRLAALLASAERPMLLIGGSRWNEQGCAAIARFAEAFALPVATTLRRRHLFDALHPNYAGDLGIGPNPKLVARVKASDLVVLVGGRLSEMQSQGYTLIDIPTPQMTFVHVHPGVEELGRVYRPHLAINATPTPFALAAAALKAPANPRWLGSAKAAHDEYRAFTDVPTTVPGGVNLGEIIVWLRENLPTDFDDLQRRRQFHHLGSPVLPVPQIRHPIRADRRLDGLRRAGGHRDQAALSGAHRGGGERRRRFFDERPGFRHRGAVRRGR